MAKKGKGLTQEQLERFNQNEGSWQNGFLTDIKQVSDLRSREFLQLKRKYQSSFVEIENYRGRFTHKFSNPNEVHENISPSVKRNGLLSLEVHLPEDYQSVGCEFLVLNEEITDVFKEILQESFKLLTVQFQSVFHALKYIDNHMQIISAKALDKVRDRREKLEMESKVSELSITEPIIDENQFGFVLPLRKLSKEDPKTEEIKTEEIEKEASDTEEENKAAKPKRKRFELRDKSILIVIAAQQLVFKNYGSGSLQSCTIEVECLRCGTVSSFLTTQGDEDIKTGTKCLLASGECQCTLRLNLTLYPIIIHQKTGFVIANSCFDNCKPIDIRDATFAMSCLNCGTDAVLSSVRSHATYNESCQQCFNKQMFRIEGIDYLDKNTDKHDEKDREQFLGKPLPKNGVCKHFKQSFRWFRYACCKKLFPCTICHDAVTTHKGESADFFVCGYCGLEQPMSKELCKRCANAVTKGEIGNKQFWEGGKGCRTTEKLSRKDKRKFKKK